MKLGTFRSSALVLAGSLLAATAVAQDNTPSQSTSGLNIPQNPEFFRQDPSVRKATAIVNGTVITGTDVDHRLRLLLMSANTEVPAEEVERLRAQVLRNLVDETLQIQAAEAQDIKVDQREVDGFYARYAQSMNRSPEEFSAYLRANGTSDRSIKRQIHGEIAWARLQDRNIKPFVDVSEEEVRSIIERLNAAKGTHEYRVSEIFLSATPETASEVQANAARILQQIQQGASFPAYARQFSEASTAAVGGDLGWVRAAQLPGVLAQAVQEIPVGGVSNPIPIPGGFSILAIQDSRQVLTANPRDAVLSLKQLSISFPPGTTREQAAPMVAKLAQAGRTLSGCGGAEAAAAAIGAEVVSSDQTRVRDLPPALQDTMLNLNVGEATDPFGSLDDAIRILVLCGRDDPVVNEGPSFDRISAQLNEERVNRRAQRYLRDLRRDAVIDYR